MSTVQTKPRRSGAIAAALAAVSAIALAGAACSQGWAPARAVKVPPAAVATPVPAAGQETAVLAGGCFWGLQGVFQHVRGVEKVYAGYAGGTRATADYETVSTGTTGHAESVEIVFDPRQISFAQILQIYFSVATDPTEVNRQYPDEGPQYRGEIFFMNPSQQAIATHYIAQLNAAHVFHGPIATRVDAYTGFYKAEGYHQDYLLHHPDSAYIATFDMPKVAALKAMFPTSYRSAPVRT
jgi:peptide-methionine (S)-S-oxide reductase